MIATQSMVTVGGFDAAELKSPSQEMVRIFRTFGAGFNTPEDPLQNAKLERVVQHRAAASLQQFHQQLAGMRGQISGGLKPKFARVPPKSKNARVIPFDIYPEVVEVPKKTISSGFAWRR